jgi:hypothetical protein
MVDDGGYSSVARRESARIKSEMLYHQKSLRKEAARVSSRWWI